ncbi:hypothetical protein ACFL3T_01360 [Patescibacteria group bacterium]
MELSLYLGQLFSVVLVVIGLALLLRSKHYAKAYKAWMKDAGLALFTGMVVLVAGVAVVLVHNVWIASWEVLITIVGWGMVLKGVLFLLLPKEFEKLVDYFMKMSWLLPLGAVIWIVGGLYLGYNVWM